MSHSSRTLRFLTPHGAEVEAVATDLADEPPPAGTLLQARRVMLEHADGTTSEVRHLSPAEATEAAYDALDNEILAGLRLSRLCGPRPHPPSVSRLIGYEAHGVRPFALLEPYRGRPIADTGGKILPTDKPRFQESLLAGARWISAAGIAHRAISPAGVHWDSVSVQITGFENAAPVGAPRTVAGVPPWQPPEQRHGQVSGEVTAKDDVWAVGRLIYYVSTGRELLRGDQIGEKPELAHLLAGVIGPMDGRPTVRELLGRLNLPDPVPRPVAADEPLARGRAEFFALRARKHPETIAEPPEPPLPAQPVRQASRLRRRWGR